MINGVYLAYPIDQRSPHASDVAFYERVEEFKQGLVESKAVGWVYDPGDAFSVTSAAVVNDSLPRINRAALNNADVVVAFLPRGISSIGVPLEIDRAHAQGKQTILLSDITESWMLQWPNRVRRLTDFSDTSLAIALEWLLNMDPPVVNRQMDDLPFKVDVEGCLPTRTYADDAGLDLIVSEDLQIPLGQFRDVPCGVSVELPSRTWGLVTGRSSAFRKRGLLVLPGIIDPGYRGPLFAGCFAQTDAVVLKKGERIAQLIIMSNQTRYMTPIEVQGLTQSERGGNGFGSTGA